MHQGGQKDIGKPWAYMSRVLLIALLACFNLGVVSTAIAEQWILGVPKDDRPPLTFTENGKHVGLIVDIVREVGRRVGVNITTEVVGAAERRKGFVQGKYVIECCIIEGWRSRPEEIAIQLFSDPVLQIQDIFLFPPHKAFPIPTMKVLKDKSVGTLRGYSYKGEENFGSRVDHESVLLLLEGISSGQVDVGIFQRRAAAFHSRQRQLNLTFGPLHHEVQASIRLHKNKAAYLPAINDAIRGMQKDGTFKRLSDKHSSWMRK